MPATPSRKIAILFHENESPDSARSYAVSRMADFWREDGHEIFFLFGTSQFIPADLVFVHVNLSVVPELYFEFARRYPIVVNGEAGDIRKSSFSRNILRSGDTYEGKVIVKSDLNYGGAPEKILAVSALRRHSFSYRLRGRYQRIRSLWFADSRSYRIYSHISQVPRRLFEMPGLVAEKFLPEMDGTMFCVRNYSFLGDRAYALRLRSDHPIVNGYTYKDLERVEPHPEIVAARERLKFDFGKFDYVVVDGKVILLDMNKTLGPAAAEEQRGEESRMNALRRYRAEGIYSYFR